ncbi:MAG: SbcC/MukB-like Walker B domain-containing protein [Treponema sp.]
MRPKELVLYNIGPFAGEHRIAFDMLSSFFLICGETGAGKTTLFDALAYAFYGKPLGGRSGITKSLRSHFAPEEAIARVILSFTMGPDTYRITRVLPYTKKGNKNETPEEVSLAQYTDSAWKDMSSTNKRETDAAIRKLIKLNEKEFARIVLLPQGEFAQFLQAHSSEKKETLLNLFPVTRYTELMRMAKTRADAVRQEVQLITGTLEQLNRVFSAPDYPETSARMQTELAAIRKTQHELIETLHLKNTEREQAKILNEKRKEYARMCDILKDLHAREKDIAVLRTNIEAAQRALPLALMVTQLQEIEAALHNTERIIEEKQLQLEKLTVYLAQLADREAEIAEKERLKDTLTASSTALEKAVHIEAELQHDRSRAQTLQQRIAEHSTAWQNSDVRIAETTEHMAELQQDLDQLDARQAQYQKLQEQLTLERRLPDMLRKKVQLHTVLHNYTEAQAHTAQELQDIAKDIDILTENLKQLEQDKRTAEQEHRAALLAKLLTDGTPCPVCGSVHHPTPAQEQHASMFTLEERIQTTQRSIQAAQKKKESLQQSHTEISTTLKGYEEQLVEHEGALATLCSQHRTLTGTDFPAEPEAATQQLAATARTTEQAAHACAASQKALHKKKSLEETLHALQQRQATLIQEKNSDSVQLSSIQSSMQEKTKQLDHAYSLLPQTIPQAADAETMLEQCTALLQEIKFSINTFHAEQAEARQSKERVAGELATTTLQQAAQSAQYADKKKTLEQSIRQEGFAGIEELQQSVCDETTLTAWKTTVAEFAEQYIAHQQTAANLEQELAQTEPADMQALDTAIAELSAQYDAAQHRLEQLTAEKAQLDEKHTQHDVLTQQLLVKTEQAQHAVSLSDDLNGSNSRRLQFDTWALAHFLRTVTLFANQRLERMSEGRYHITVSEAYGSGNNYKGLDLEIADSYTGKCRPSASLSGGETFMASISLALGLADSIQARTGGVRIDSMFIDEGFGSLDEKALENAITILDEIRGNRMVGIISHVNELKSRIPQKIEVIKTGTGSYIQGQV